MLIHNFDSCLSGLGTANGESGSDSPFGCDWMVFGASSFMTFCPNMAIVSDIDVFRHFHTFRSS